MSVKLRIYEDYLKKSRLKIYREVLQLAKDNGYNMVGVLDFYEMITDGQLDFEKKILLNRHDIDTSPKVARKMFEIEKEVYGRNGSATYYFRDTTINKKLISDIKSYGYETGYHYEELAKVIKKYRLKDKAAVEKLMDEISKMFLYDLQKYRINTNSESKTVASHGDFVNTKLQMQSYEILKDQNIRNEAGIILEAYDAVIMDKIQLRIADQIEINEFPNRIKWGISNGISKIMILTHPRNWEIDFASNTKENFRRVVQGVMYKRQELKHK